MRRLLDASGVLLMVTILSIAVSCKSKDNKAGSLNVFGGSETQEFPEVKILGVDQ